MEIVLWLYIIFTSSFLIGWWLYEATEEEDDNEN